MARQPNAHADLKAVRTHVVLAGFRDSVEAERVARTAGLQLQMNAIRQIVRYLRPERLAPLEPAHERDA